MSQKGEKYVRGVERSLSGLEERLGCVQAGQEAQSEMILQVLRERTAAEETAARRLRCMRRRAVEAERKAELWRVVAAAAVLAMIALCLAVILAAPAGTAAAAETAEPVPADPISVGSDPVSAGFDPVQEKSEPDPVRVIQDCVVSYYCCERYPHICGTGDGITATGTEARPWVTCAVDPAVIPLGSAVTVDFGSGETVECVAEDVGQLVQGEHVDICVAGHQEALELGLRRAVVRWEERP